MSVKLVYELMLDGPLGSQGSPPAEEEEPPKVCAGIFTFRPSQAPSDSKSAPAPPLPSPRRRRGPGNVCTGFCSAAEHHSLFTTHHLRSHMPEVLSVNLQSCQTPHVLHLETSLECTKRLIIMKIML
ncbi:hypothetical protein NDU88_007890 [Pleurodeles waltl]|uniref:Uncharacterized protein n=1 Tax=Pleurodeles waltl TaxID=8319 RepID=A0AAV7SU39_PLEWA|nr:hypothetical protein NDU88_007890 [Pleurodeles waltl]